VHRQVDPAGDQSIVDLLGNERTGADLGQGELGNEITRRGYLDTIGLLATSPEAG
jgi:hypothetical protein